MDPVPHFIRDPELERLLVLYYAGQCSDDERARVEKALAEFPGEGWVLEVLKGGGRQDALFSPSVEQSFEALLARVRATMVSSSPVALTNEPMERSIRVLNDRANTQGMKEFFVRERVSVRENFERRGEGRVERLGKRILRQGLWIGVLSAVIAGMVFLNRRGGETHADVRHLYATSAYQQAILNLDDGTRVTLAPQTTLRVLQLGSQARTVVLESGEAYFEVAHASGAPFVVRSGAATAQVLGTAFLVRRDADNRHVRVAVTDGKVRVTTPARADTGVTLTLGQIGDVADSTAQVSTTDDLRPGTEWAPGRIVFHDTPLETVLQTVSRWYGYQFRYSDKALSTRSVTIIVSTRSSAEALAELERVLAVNLRVVGDTITLVPQPPRSSRSAPRIQTYDVWTPTREVGR